MYISNGNIIFHWGVIIFLVSSLSCCLLFCLINGAHSQSQLAVTLPWEVTLCPRILRNTWSQQPGLGFYGSEIHTDEHTHTEAYKCNPPICKYISPQRNGSSFLGHSNRLIKPRKKAFDARAGLGFGLELMKGNTEYVSPALKEGLCAEGAVSAADLSCVLLDDCTAPLITMDNPLLWDWNGWWHQKDDCEE